MAKEVTIKELLKKAGVDGARYQELASYLAAHAVYAVELNDNDSESNANQAQSNANQTQILVFDPNSEEEKK